MLQKKVSPRSAFWIIVILLGFFQNWLLTIIPQFGYFDEILAVYFLFYYLFAGSIKKTEAGLLLYAGVIAAFGLFCNAIYQIQSSIVAIGTDVISTFKFLFIFLGVKKYLSKHNVNRSQIARGVCVVLKPYLMVLALLAMINMLFDLGYTAEIRYGLRSFAFVYGSPGHIINQVTYMMLILNAVELESTKKTNTFWKFLCGLLLLATLKTRAFLLFVVYLALVYYIRHRRKRKLGLEIGIIGVIVALLGYSQFEHYFGSVGTPRQMFVAGAVKLAREYFPFGTGFATFGSSAAADHYSPLYYQLGFSTRWGMSADYQLYLNDNYLPMIFAQFGLVFGIAFLVLLLKFAQKVIRDKKRCDTVATRIVTYAFLADVFLSSVQSSYLAHYSVVMLTMLFVLLFYPDKKDINKGVTLC